MGLHKLLAWNTLESQSVSGVTPYEVIYHGEFVLSFFGETLLGFILALGDSGGTMTDPHSKLISKVRTADLPRILTRPIL